MYLNDRPIHMYYSNLANVLPMLMYCYFILTEYHYAYWYMHRASVSRLKKIVYQCLTVPVHRHRLRIWLSSLRLVLNLLRLIHIPFCSLIRLLVLDTSKSKPTTWIRFQNVDWWIRGVVRHAWSVASWSWDAHGSAVVESCKGGGGGEARRTKKNRNLVRGCFLSHDIKILGIGNPHILISSDEVPNLDRTLTWG